MKITLFVLAYNEIEGMKAIMPKIQKEWVDQIIVADGGSTDGTIEYAKEQGYDVHIQKEKGPRQAYNETFPLCVGDIVITFSPDGNSIPEVIPSLITKFKEGYDMVIASRYLGDAKSYDDGVLTGIGNRIFTKSINFFHGGNYTDALVMYRAYRKSLFYELDLHKDESYNIEEKLFFTKLGIEPLLSVRAAKAKKKIGEIAANEPARIGPETKWILWRNIRWGLAYFTQVLKEIFYWKQ